MKFSFKFMTKMRIRTELFRAEAEARWRGNDLQVEDPDWRPSVSTCSPMTEDEEIRYRRIMAKLHYGKETATPEYEAFLTQEERDHLDAYVIQQRWSEFWALQSRGKE